MINLVSYLPLEEWGCKVACFCCFIFMSQEGGGKGREVSRLIGDFIYLYLFCMSVQKQFYIYAREYAYALVYI